MTMLIVRNKNKSINIWDGDHSETCHIRIIMDYWRTMEDFTSYFFLLTDIPMCM